MLPDLGTALPLRDVLICAYEGTAFQDNTHPERRRDLSQRAQYRVDVTGREQSAHVAGSELIIPAARGRLRQGDKYRTSTVFRSLRLSYRLLTGI